MRCWTCCTEAALSRPRSAGRCMNGPTATWWAARCCARCRSQPGGPGSAGSGFFSTPYWPMIGTPGALRTRCTACGSAAWDRYRVDRARRVPPAPARRLRLRRRDGDALTVACDGERTFKVFDDEVRVGPASDLDEGQHGDLLQLLDGSWLLMYRLSGGAVVEVDGRPGTRSSRRSAPGRSSGHHCPGCPPAGCPPWPWSTPRPAGCCGCRGTAMGRSRLDWSCGRCLTVGQTTSGSRRRKGCPWRRRRRTRIRLRDLTWTRGTRGTHTWSGEWIHAGDPARIAADAVKKQVDEKIAAARGFLGSFLGGRDA